MLGAALAVLAAVMGVRAVYPALLERRAARRRPIGPDGIIDGAAPVSLARPGAPAVLLLHGGGDTPQVMAGLAEFLHEQGFAVSAPLMASHGRSLSELHGSSASAWLADVVAEHERLTLVHRWVGVVGLSIGGALAARLAAERPGRVPALVLLAPYLDMPRYARGLARTAAFWRWILPYLPSGSGRSIHDPSAAVKALGHGILTPTALAAFHQTVVAGAQALPRVKAPTLVIQSRQDNRISVSAAERAFALLGAAEKEMVWREGAGHVITVDYGHQEVYRLVAEWLDAHRD